MCFALTLAEKMGHEFIARLLRSAVLPDERAQGISSANGEDSIQLRRLIDRVGARGVSSVGVPGVPGVPDRGSFSEVPKLESSGRSEISVLGSVRWAGHVGRHPKTKTASLVGEAAADLVELGVPGVPDRGSFPEVPKLKSSGRSEISVLGGVRWAGHVGRHPKTRRSRGRSCGVEGARAPDL